MLTRKQGAGLGSVREATNLKENREIAEDIFGKKPGGDTDDSSSSSEEDEDNIPLWQRGYGENGSAGYASLNNNKSKKRRKIIRKRKKNLQKTGFRRLWPLRVRLGYVKLAQKRAQDGLDGKLGRLGRQIGRLGCHVGRFGRQVGSPGRSKRRSEPSPSPFRTRAQARPKARTLGRRFFFVFVLSRASADVLPDTVFTRFYMAFIGFMRVSKGLRPYLPDLISIS